MLLARTRFFLSTCRVGLPDWPVSVACAGEEEDPLPAEVRALINKAKEADTPGNEAAAIALFENSAKQASPTQPNPLTA